MWVHNKLVAMGFTGSDRSTRRAVAAAKKAWQAGHRRVFRPWIPEPGLWLQFDWGDGPRIAGRRSLLFCAWLAWSRFRVIIPVWERLLAVGDDEGDVGVDAFEPVTKKFTRILEPKLRLCFSDRHGSSLANWRNQIANPISAPDWWLTKSEGSQKPRKHPVLQCHEPGGGHGTGLPRAGQVNGHLVDDLARSP